VFPKKPLEGKPSEGMMKLIASMPEGVTPDNIMTEANIAEKRIEYEQSMEGNLAAFKDVFEEHINMCKITNFELQVDEGTHIKVFVIIPNSLPKEGNAC